MLDLNDFYWAGEAAEVLTRNSGHKITVDYVRRLIAYGLLRPVQVNGRNLYRKVEVEAIVVRELNRRKDGNVA